MKKVQRKNLQQELIGLIDAALARHDKPAAEKTHKEVKRAARALTKKFNKSIKASENKKTKPEKKKAVKNNKKSPASKRKSTPRPSRPTGTGARLGRVQSIEETKALAGDGVTNGLLVETFPTDAELPSDRMDSQEHV